MPNEFDDKKYETTDGENPYTDNFSEPPEQNETVREQTQNAQPEPSAETTNFIPYDQYTGGNPYTDKKEQPNPYSAHSEPFSYSPYSGGKAENDKFTPIDYNSRGAQTKSKNNGIIIFLTILIVVFALAAAAFGGMYFLGRPSENKISGKAETGAVNSGPALAINSKPASDDNVSESSDGKLTVTQIAKKVRPSVVGIVAYSSQSSLENFGQSSASSGSGVIMSSDGYIITNAHVIEGAARIEVVLDNGDECEGKLIGSDSKTDLAVVKINKKISPSPNSAIPRRRRSERTLSLSAIPPVSSLRAV